ncbi:hypothetical protein [Cytobacillus firmus]|uniref:hypothetical protein n=1 Tax=Cytobacillus firmus TaxID=1399 RepID=UPI003002C135
MEDLLAPVGSIYKSKFLIDINGEVKTISAWAKEAGLAFSTVKRRNERGIRGIDLLRKGRVKSNGF